MLNETVRKHIAGEIMNCFKTRKQIPRLLTTYPDLEIKDSYLIQEEIIARRVAEGAKVKGYKIGITSKPMQELSGTNEPDYSGLLDYMFIPESSTIAASDWFDPMIEVEIAFVMKSELQGPNVNAADVIRATDFVLPSMEIVDFRVSRSNGYTAPDSIADLAAVGAVILGGNPRRLEDVDIRYVNGALIRNGEIEQSGFASAVLGNPINSVAWLANKLHEFGVSFKPGHVIMSGSFIRAVPFKAGDNIVARFDHGFGSVGVFIK
jgi:2-keto-4-pentenoate hydratase